MSTWAAARPSPGDDRLPVLPDPVRPRWPGRRVAQSRSAALGEGADWGLARGPEPDGQPRTDRRHPWFAEAGDVRRPEAGAAVALNAVRKLQEHMDTSE